LPKQLDAPSQVQRLTTWPRLFLAKLEPLSAQIVARASGEWLNGVADVNTDAYPPAFTAWQTPLWQWPAD
jgi:hypothetical protein